MSTIGADSSQIQAAFNKPSIKASLQQLHSILNAAKIDLADFNDGLEYSGFDRERIGSLCAERFGAKGTAKLILIGVKRGTRLDKILKASVKNDKEVEDWFKKGLIKAGGKGPDIVSIGRIMACFPDCAVLIGQMFGIRGKFTIPGCPAELQFPAAASLPMSGPVRAAHIEFCKKFGELIKSPFNPDFYKIAFSAMLPVDQVDSRVLEILGSPDDRTARGVDIEAFFGNGGVTVQPYRASSHSQTRTDDVGELFSNI